MARPALSGLVVAVLLALAACQPQETAPAIPGKAAPSAGEAEAIVTPGPEDAGAIPPLPAGGIPMFGGGDFARLQLQVRAGMATATAVAVADMPFAQAHRIDVAQAAKNAWDIELKAKVAPGAAKGDTLHLRLFLRGERLQDAVYMVTGNAGYQVADPPYAKLVLSPVMANDAWSRYDFPFRLDQDLAPEGSALFFHLGSAAQAVDIGGVELWNYGPDVDPGSLPKTVFSYDGREPDAPWRQEALARIERIRKGDMAVVVTDAAGRPLPGAKVEVEMTRHAYGFGCVVGGWWGNRTSPDAERYRAEFARLFNETVHEGAMKWPTWEDPRRKAEADATLADMERLGIPMRGHCLVWPREKWLPKRIVELYGQPEILRQEVLAHIAAIGGHFRGRVCDWDVVNEPFQNHELMDILGDEAMVDWYRAARAADPEAVLYLNEAAIPDWRPNIEDQMATLERWLDLLVDQGAPVGGIGLQGHMFHPFMPPAGLLGVYDRFAKYNLPIKVTEFDINEKDESLQGDYMRDFLIATFSHPATHAVILWGFWEGSHWLGHGQIFAKDWRLKPSGRHWIDLVHNQWRTRAAGEAEADGTFRLRAFFGDYRIRAAANGKEAVVTPVAFRADGTVAVALP